MKYTVDRICDRTKVVANRDIEVYSAVANDPLSAVRVQPSGDPRVFVTDVTRACTRVQARVRAETRLACSAIR